ncbi:hypothetical protein NA57DRAFT_81866 [Rhizodiscina lignyota]|uniref:CENP-C homolog n=1 Tax=Rhizodiscina lignyota TaxID=1504668 RepID=A0A9P4I4C0_9PEZI|nr:hypothetical protein NA57DRAFT_81866 [Rhizodiscina lignyota]
MAPLAGATPGRKKRENVYFEPGVQGRKTGITVKDTGRRDEHGFEPLDAIFSSPEKSPPKRSIQNIQQISSESMEVAQSSAPEPIDVLSARRLTRSARTSLPPPKARSPIKTTLHSSPQRHPSLAPHSESRRSLGSPIRTKQIASVRRRLDFDEDAPRASVETSPSKMYGISSTTGAEDTVVDTAPEVVDIQPSPVQEPLDAGEPQTKNEQEGAQLAPSEDDSIQILDGGDATEVNLNETTHLPDLLVQSTPRTAPKTNAENNPTTDSTPATTESVKRKRGRPRKSAAKPVEVAQATSDESTVDPSLLVIQEDTMAGALPSNDHSEMTTELPQSSRKAKLDVHRDETEEDEEVRPSKRARGSSVQPKPQKRKPGRSAKNASKGPKERDPNARPAPQKRSGTKDVADDEVDPKPRTARAGSKPRSLQILRQGTPLEEQGTTTTRFGRTSIQPVAWWCGERINRDYDGTIKDVVRAETVEPPKRKVSGGRKSKPKMMEDIEEEDEGDLEEWEEEGGILTGLVSAWDAEYNMTIEDDDVEMEVAFAANAIQTRDVMGSSFSYAKILTLPFFGAGIVDIPPGGFKRTKNSRKMQMIFFLHEGKVLVTVGDLEFSISKGGVWQVPRGNFYSIENKDTKPARIFFSQGFEHVAGDEIEGH